jgi:outer membrane protein assembly factor BamD (BamD/ComL family)
MALSWSVLHDKGTHREKSPRGEDTNIEEITMKLFAGFLCLGALLCAGCGKPSAEDSFKKADEAARQATAKLDTVRTDDEARALYGPAIAEFERVITDHPDHELAEAALFRIASIQNNYTRQPQEAVDSYKSYIARYPNGKQTELAMFLVGFIYNNSLHNVDSAGAAYRNFLARYPNSQYAISAQFELNTLGKPLDELLPKSEEPAKETPATPAAKKHSKKPVV